MVLVAITAVLWRDTAVSTYTISTGYPSAFDPPIALTQVEAVARGGADDETVERFSRSMRDRCERALERLAPEESAMHLGFAAPATTYRLDLRVGWPQPWYWTARSWTCEDPYTFKPPTERPGSWWPGPKRRWGRHSEWLGFWVADETCSWSFTVCGVRFDATPTNSFSTEVTLTHLGVPALAAACAAIAGSAWAARRRPVWRWRRAVFAATLAGACVGVLVVIAWATRTEMHFKGRGWREAAAPAQGWEGIAPFGERADAILDAFRAPGGAKEVAARILERVPREASDRLYLFGSIGELRDMDTTWWRVSEQFEFLSVTNSTPTRSAPTGSTATSSGRGRWRLSMPHGLPTFDWRRDDGMRTGKVTFNLGAAAWVLLAVVLAWSVPAAFVHWRRNARARRRIRRGECPRCGYITSAPSTSLSAPSR